MPDSVTDSVVKKEFYNSTVKFHVIATWVGLTLNVLWFISDYFVWPSYLIPFLIFRVSVSTISILTLLNRKLLRINIYQCMFILVLGISIQNAYMWSVMDVAHFQKHAFAYMVLFIGVGMLVLWEIRYSLILAALTIISNFYFYVLNSRLTLDEYMVNGGLITLSVVIFSIFLIRTRYRLTYNEIRIRLQLEKSKKVIEQKHEELLIQKREVQIQKDALEQKNREITDSINYAKNIQQALIPQETKFNTCFTDSFVLFKPKDIVSGDFYWIYDSEKYVYYVTADCTGHGVPGGFMTMLGLSFLEEIIVGQLITSPEIILNIMRDKIIASLNQSGTAENKDGMDICVCRLNKITYVLEFSSANNNLYVVTNSSSQELKELVEYKANRQPCGQHIVIKPFTLTTIQLQKGDCIYTFTDGYADQFGGEKGKKFRYKNFEKLLLENSNLPCSTQKQILDSTINEWRGSHEQVDDILVIGVRI